VFIGPLSARLDHHAGRNSFPAFLATRPVSAGDLVLTKLRAAGLSAAVSWLLVLTLTPLWLILWCNPAPLIEAGRRLLERYPPLFPWLLGALAILLAAAFTWKKMVGGLHLQLAGPSVRNNLMSTVGVLFPVLAVIAGLFTVERLSAAGDDELRRQAWLWAKWGFERIPWFAWILNGLVILKVWLAVWSWGRCRRRDLVSARAVVAYFAFWVAATGCLVALTHALFVLARSAEVASELDLPAHVGWLEYGVLLGLMLFLPLARMGLAPAALERNRHR
jgi:hypothetical protein